MMTKNLLFIAIIISLVIAFSCEGGSSTLEVNCGECYINEPDSFELALNISVGPDFDYDSAYVIFYNGKIESEDISWEGYVYTELFYHLVAVDKYYSVETIYENDGNKIIAVDGDRMVTRYIADGCSSDCWIIKGNLLNAELKY
jgi:hypothetical protein